MGGKSGKKGGVPTYAVDIIFALGEGVISAVPTLYRNKVTTTIAKAGLTLFNGTVGQPVWSYLTSNYPSQAVPYSGVSTLNGAGFALGASGQLPNDSYEVEGIFANTACLDADPSLVVNDILTNQQYGVGFPVTAVGTVRQAQEVDVVPGSPFQITVAHGTTFIDNLSVSIGGTPLTCVASSPGPNQYSFTNLGVYTFNSAQAAASATINYAWRDGLTDYQAYTLASGLWISPAYDSQTPASNVLQDIVKYTYSNWKWSFGVLTAVPYGSVAFTGEITGNTCIIPGTPGLGELVYFWKWKGADITLSANNTVATVGTVSGAGETVAVNIAIPKGGKFRYQIQIGSVSGGCAVGAISPLSGFTPPPPDIATVFSNSSWGVQENGCTGRMITAPSGWPTTCTFGYCQIDSFTTGDILDVCVDATGANALWWFRTIHNGVAQAWNDSDDVGLPSDPATGTHPFSSGMSAGSDSGWYPAVSFYNNNMSATWNGGPTFVGDTPSGFVPLNQFFTFTPATVQFDLGLDDFLSNQSGSSTGNSISDSPVIVTRKRVSDQINTIRLEFLDRANRYATSIAEYTNRALVDKYGRRFSGVQTAHLFTTAQAANLSAQLLSQRESVRKMYSFVLDERYIVLDPMDIVTLTESGCNLDHELVRIVEMTENDDGNISFLAEEVPDGSGGIALHSFNSSVGTQPQEEDPGFVNPPIFFVEPAALATPQTNLLAMALSGINPNWGGCLCYVSLDGPAGSYVQFATKVGEDVMGQTTSALPFHTSPDTTSVLGVDVSESLGTITSATSTQADAGQALAFVDGELIGYTDAALTGTHTYNLDTYIDRGMFGTPISAHPSAVPFAIATKSIITYNFSPTLIGSTLWFKFPSFNITGGGQQTLAQAVPYPFFLGVPSTMNIIASEAIAAGAIVSVWDNSGVANVRNANATDNTKPADGFVLTVGVMGSPVTVYFPGAIDSSLTGLTPGATYYLDIVAGGINTVAPSASGNLQQQVGKALSATQLIFAPYPGITL